MSWLAGHHERVRGRGRDEHHQAAGAALELTRATPLAEVGGLLGCEPWWTLGPGCHRGVRGWRPPERRREGGIFVGPLGASRLPGGLLLESLSLRGQGKSRVPVSTSIKHWPRMSYTEFARRAAGAMEVSQGDLLKGTILWEAFQERSRSCVSPGRRAPPASGGGDA